MKQLKYSRTVDILQDYRMPLPKEKLVSSAETAAKAAKKIGFPVVMKIASKDIIHKSDEGFVKTNIKDETEAEETYGQMISRAKEKKAEVEGVVIQETVSGKEVIIGMKKDPQFGPVLLFGLGGVFVEIIKDISFRIAPIDKKQAEQMIKETKGAKILEGIRGEKPANVAKLADIISKLSNLAVKKENIQEIDLNPVIVDEKGAKIVDARFLG